MSQEGQPRDPRITFYIPENWLPLSPEEGGQQFVNYPITQTSNISFPGAILCSNLKSFAPSAPMNLYNDSTSGNIEFANNSGYTGGIVMNANAVAPVNNTIRIGDSSRALIAPLINTTEIYGTGPFSTLVNVNADLNIATGSALYTNAIEKNTGSTLTIGESSVATINLGTDALRNLPINIGTNMTVTGNINLGGTNGTTNAPKVKTNNIQSDTTLVIQPSDSAGAGTVQMGCGTTRTGLIDIGSTTNTAAGSTGNVNIMCGTGRNEGSFNVLTNFNNRGVINLGNISSLSGGINIYSEFNVGLRLGYSPTLYSGVDTVMGGYKQGTYNNPGSLTIDVGDKRIVGSIPTILSNGVYQFNAMTTTVSNIYEPYLKYGVYTKTGSAWVNGALVTSGTSVVELTRSNRYMTTNFTEEFTASLSGILIITTKSYVAVVLEIAEPIAQDLTSTNTYMSVVRVG
jgi:hypothetical protein